MALSVRMTCSQPSELRGEGLNQLWTCFPLLYSETQPVAFKKSQMVVLLVSVDIRQDTTNGLVWLGATLERKQVL